MLTTGALFFGFFAIIQGSLGKFDVAAAAVLIALVLDGRVARLTNTTSEFGKEFDSLSDFICFGLAPALISFDPPRVLFLVFFVYALSGPTLWLMRKMRKEGNWKRTVLRRRNKGSSQ